MIEYLFQPTDHPRAIPACMRILEALLSRIGEPDLQNSPVKQFSVDQVFLGAREIYQRLESEVSSECPGLEAGADPTWSDIWLAKKLAP